MTVGSNVFDGVDCQITIQKKGGSVYTFGGRVSGYNRTGFEKPLEYEPLQGLYFENRKPITPATISFDVIIDVDSDEDALNFSDIIYEHSSPLAGVRENQLTEDYDDYKVKIEFVNYTGTYGTLGTNDEAYKELYYNARGISFEKNSDSSAYLSGTFTFTVSPFNELGSSNYLEVEKIVGQSATNYNTAESSKDSDMGY